MWCVCMGRGGGGEKGYGGGGGSLMYLGGVGWELDGSCGCWVVGGRRGRRGRGYVRGRGESPEAGPS